MQLNYAEKWIRARIGVWSIDPALRATVLGKLASALGVQRVGERVAFSSPGRWAREMRARITRGEQVEVIDQEGSLRLDGQRLDLEVVGCGPDHVPEAFSLDGLVLAAADDPLPSLASLRSCPMDLGMNPDDALLAFHLQAPADFPDLPDVPRCVGPDPEPPVREAIGVLVGKLFR